MNLLVGLPIQIEEKEALTFLKHNTQNSRGKKGNLAPSKRGRERQNDNSDGNTSRLRKYHRPPVLIQTSMPPSTSSSNQLLSTSQRLHLSLTRTQEHHQLIFNTPSRALLYQFQPSPSVSEIRPKGLTSLQLTRVMLQPPIFLPSVTCTASNPSFNCPPTQSIAFPKPILGQFLV